MNTAFGIKSPAKQFAARYRGVMMRPMSTAVSKAQYEFKPFVSDPGDIDHNLYGKFLGLLKGATCRRAGVRSGMHLACSHQVLHHDALLTLHPYGCNLCFLCSFFLALIILRRQPSAYHATSAP